MVHFKHEPLRSFLHIFVLATIAAGCGADAASAVESIASTEQAVSPPPSDAAYVFAFNATGSYDGSSQTSYNSTGGKNHVSLITTGAYSIDFPGINNPNAGTMQVTAYGSGSERCKVTAWGSSSTGHVGVGAGVKCFSASGDPVNTQFIANYVRRTGTIGAEGGYVIAYDSTNPSYTASSTFQWNSTGQAITITRGTTGSYAVTFEGQSVAGGTYEVTALGPGNSYCTLGIGTSSAINVNCFDGTTHQPTDSQFTLNFNRNSPNNIRSYSYSRGAVSSAPWSKGFIFGCYDGNGHAVGSTPAPGQVIHYDTGFYQVTFPGMAGFPKFPNNVMVTAVQNADGSNSGGACKVQFFSTVGNDAYANVYCIDPSGTELTDNDFMITYSSAVYTIC